ncbi:uncharacterized protein LOC109521340 [Hippocampus comes]|uniref:uncharacterized protein LOC109521340 n=1 Tax=Hippocampus comes TaxID=109280 RepID=UPI00094E2BD8|nr:PREDICTED: uncharacterized protein LOC109521340 [Hippocampus comes]
MNDTRLQVATEQSSPAVMSQESPRSVPLPPPIIPETQKLLSEASSGYMSTAPLSDVYTLSWDLPPSSGQRAASFAAVTNEEDEEAMQRLSFPSEGGSGSEPQEAFPATAENTDLPQYKPKDSSLVHLNRNLRDPNASHAAQEIKASSACAASDSPTMPVHLERDPMAPKQVDSVLTPPNSFFVEEQQPETFAPESVQTNVKEASKAIQKVCEKNQPSNPDRTETDPEAPASVFTHTSSEPPPVPPKNCDPPSCSQEKSPFMDSSGSAILAPSSEEVHLAATSAASAKPSKSPAAAVKPFKIQKVQSSDLKSFRRILGEPEGDPVQTETGSASPSHSNLAEPLELILDCGEGAGAAAVSLPDWLKEGEFVTVGTNKSGVVRYVGPTDFAQGVWVGVELEVPAGKNDGSVGGKHYFHCNPGYGVLVRPDRVSRGGAKRRRQQQKRRSANLSGSTPNLEALTALPKGDAAFASSSSSLPSHDGAEDLKNS